MEDASQLREHRVLHVMVPQREGSIGGADLHVLDLAREQQRAGLARVMVLAPRAPDHYLRRLRSADIEAFRPTRLWSRELYRLPTSHGISLIHSHGYDSSYLVAAMRSVSGHWRERPAVMTMHGWIETNWWLRAKSTLDRISARWADAGIAMARSDVARFRPGGGVVRVIHNGVSVPASPVEAVALGDRGRVDVLATVPKAGPVIGTVGRLSSEKRIDLFLAAAQRIGAVHADAHFLVVGGGALLGDLQKQAVEAGLTGRVTFTGLVDEMDAIYGALDLFVLASDTESTPRTILEAFARKVPVIATAVGDIPEVLDYGRAGFLVPKGNPSAIAEAALRILSDTRLAQELRDCGHERFLERYTIARMCEQITHVYPLAHNRHAERSQKRGRRDRRAGQRAGKVSGPASG